MHIPERDWKHLRNLKDVALDRFCASILSECADLASKAGKTNHERYLAVYKHIRRRDGDLAEAFDDLRRSTAVRRLAAMYALDLITEEEMSQFTAGTQDSVRFLADLIDR